MQSESTKRHNTRRWLDCVVRSAESESVCYCHVTPDSTIVGASRGVAGDILFGSDRCSVVHSAANGVFEDECGLAGDGFTESASVITATPLATSVAEPFSANHSHSVRYTAIYADRHLTLTCPATHFSGTGPSGGSVGLRCYDLLGHEMPVVVNSIQSQEVSGGAAFGGFTMHASLNSAPSSPFLIILFGDDGPHPYLCRL